MKAQQNKLSGGASNLLAHEDLGQFEEARHWNIQAKFGRALGPGATVGILGMGVPKLSCLRPAAWLNSGPVQPVFIDPSQDPREGPSLAGRTTQGLPQGRPCQAGS